MRFTRRLTRTAPPSRRAASDRAQTARLLVGLGLLPQLYGVCCWMSFGLFPDGPGWAAVQTAYAEASSLACALSFLPWFLIPLARTSPRLRPHQVAVVCLCIGLGLAWALTALGLAVPAAAACAGVLAGAGMASLTVAWECVLARQDRVPPHVLGPLAMLVSPGAFLALLLVPQGWVSTIVSFVFAPVNLVLLRQATRSACTRPDNDQGGGIPGAPVRTVPAVRNRAALSDLAPQLICGVVLTIMTTVADTTILHQSMATIDKVACANAGLGVSSLVILAAQRATGRALSIADVFRVLTPVLILALFTAPFAPQTVGIALMVMGLTCFFFVQTLCMSLCAELSARHGTPLASLYAFACATVYGAKYAGEKIGLLVFSSSVSNEMQTFAVIGIAIYLVTLASMFLRRRQIRKDKGDRGRDPAATEAPRHAVPEQDPAAAARLMVAYGLTPREAQIALLLCEGRNVPAIAEVLSLSKDTVRSHVKQLYKKCAVHSREDLVVLIGPQGDGVPTGNRGAGRD